MELKNNRDQHYAVNKEGKLIHINEAQKNNEDVFCPHCGALMIKKCGDIRCWHFAHDYRDKPELKDKCSYESYLHSYAKLRLKQWFDESSEIMIHYSQKKYCSLLENCIWRTEKQKCQISVNEKYNLKRSLSECKVEEEVRVGRFFFRADLLWLNPNDTNNKILIEIKVSHECTYEKINSGARIIEFDIKSEEDIEKIISHDIKESDKIRFYGFTKEKPITEFSPKVQLFKFILYKNGSIYPRRECTCKDYAVRNPSSLLEITVKRDHENLFNTNRIFKINTATFYNWCVEYAYRLCDLPNCYLCKHKEYNCDNKEPICKEKSSKIETPIDAQGCRLFNVKSDLCKKYERAFTGYIVHNAADIWFDGETKFHYS